MGWPKYSEDIREIVEERKDILSYQKSFFRDHKKETVEDISKASSKRETVIVKRCS